MSAAEFDLIDRIRSRAGARADVVLGIGDDAAVLRMPPDRQLVVTADTLNAGVHFPERTAPADIGWKALAVNLSDLAAMAAEPAWCTLSLSLPSPAVDWIDAFLDGFLALAEHHGIALVGGDTTRGPLSVSVTAMGRVREGAALRRDGARIGDDIWVTGTLGDAAAGLSLLAAVDGGNAAHASVDAHLLQRLNRPTPRVEAGMLLAGMAHSGIDVSDGLLADLGHICACSAVGARIALADLPASSALLGAFDEAARWCFQATGGDDYELCFTAAVVQREAVMRALESAATSGARIGQIVEGRDVWAFDADGAAWTPARTGYVHFAG